jgi:hypothetical protein
MTTEMIIFPPLQVEHDKLFLSRRSLQSFRKKHEVLNFLNVMYSKFPEEGSGNFLRNIRSIYPYDNAIYSEHSDENGRNFG